MLAGIPDEMKNNPAYNQFLFDGGFYDKQLTPDNEQLIEIYNKIIDPTNLTLNWTSYYLLCEKQGYKDRRDNVDLLVYMRQVINETENSKTKRFKDTDNFQGNERDGEDETIRRIG